VRAALEQAHAQVRFEPRDLVADGRGREVQLDRGQRKAASASHRFKGLQVGDGGQSGHGVNPAVE